MATPSQEDGVVQVGLLSTRSREVRIGQLEDALRPFAALGATVDAFRHEDNSTCLHRLSARDIRRASAALEIPGPREDEDGEGVKPADPSDGGASLLPGGNPPHAGEQEGAESSRVGGPSDLVWIPLPRHVAVTAELWLQGDGEQCAIDGTKEQHPGNVENLAYAAGQLAVAAKAIRDALRSAGSPAGESK